MIRENKLKYLISSVIIILPSIVSLFIKGDLSGMLSGAWFFTWLMPLILFALHTGLLIMTRYIDSVKQDKKIENMIFFTIPAVSLYLGAIFIALRLGLDFNIGVICAAVIGIGFIVMGNYLPKAKRNRTFGIKLKWTIANDDNWVATHRLSGKLFVIAGVLILLTAFLPASVMFIILTLILVIIAAVPTIYSYRFYKRQIASGEATEEDYSYGKSGSKKGVVAIIVFLVLAVLIVIVLMSVGNLKFEFTESALGIKPTFGGGIELEYSELKDATIEYREEKIPGTRVMGYGSIKLLYGSFNNDEFGNYVRYTYTDSEASIVIYYGEDVIVLADKDAELTKALHDELVAKIQEAKK